MSTRISQQTASLPPITLPELEDYFQKAARPRDQWKFGAEFEKILVYRASGRQVPYEGSDGIRQVLTRLAERYNWQSFDEAGNIVALLRDGATITIEPGGQVELSSALHTDMAGLEAELFRHRDELWSVVDRDRVAFLALGLTPFSPVEQIAQVPKERYRIMAEYLPPLGDHALYMMRGTASVQASFDFADEADASAKLFTALTLSPLINSMFGNAPVYAGKLTGVVSYRGHIWTHMDPARSGFLADVVRDGEFSFHRWVQYLLDVPMMFYCLENTFTRAHGRTFRDFMEHGLDGYYPTLEDWEMHITEVFPEVRLKKFIEVRGADCVSPRLSLSVPAVWKGLFYDQQSLEAALSIARRIPPQERAEVFKVAYTQGLRGSYGGRTINDWCRELVSLASDGLERQARASGREDERRFLDPVLEVLDRRQSPGAQLIELWPKIGDDPAKVVKALEF